MLVGGFTVGRVYGLLFVFFVPMMGGCAGTSKTAQGAGIGAMFGAGTGAIIGEAAGGKAGPGALLGLAAGTILGGAIGNEEDRRDRDALIQAKNEAEANQQQGSPIGMTDVIQLTQQNVGDDVIITQIRSTNSTFQLSTEDLRSLKANNVSDRVIMEMQQRRPNAQLTPRYVPVHSRPRYIYAPPPPPIYVIEPFPPPPPPPGIGVGVIIR